MGYTFLCVLSSFSFGMSGFVSSAKIDRKFSSSWLKHWSRELKGTGGGCTWRHSCIQGLNAIINAPFLSISWFCFLFASALISGSTSQAYVHSRIYSLSAKHNLFPEVTEKISCCFLVLDWVTWLSPSRSQQLGKSKAWWLVGPALELGMMSPSLEIHGFRVEWRGLPLRKIRMWLLEGWMNSEE